MSLFFYPPPITLLTKEAVHCDTTWYNDHRDALPDLVKDDSKSDLGDENKPTVSDAEEDGFVARDYDSRNIVHGGDHEHNLGNGCSEADRHVDNANSDAQDQPDGDVKEDIQEVADLKLVNPTETSLTSHMQARFHETGASIIANSNQATKSSSNFPYITCDRCDKAGKECHMDSYGRICADYNKQAKLCALNGVSCAGLWREYEGRIAGTRAACVSPVFTSAAPERRSSKNQNQANGADTTQADVASVEKGGNKKRRVTSEGSGNSLNKKKCVKGLAADLLGNDA